MVTNITIFLIFVTLTSVTSQTFQYSRGWTNGKRDGHAKDDVRGLSTNLERILSPCQMNKLKYLLEGKALSEKFFVPCDFADDEDNQPKRFKTDHNTDLFDAFQ
ncbi:pro-corazonin domain-containing protein [Phthorimaea operculella]|nr:pro-corazonin domain-containing protein [Phthorimaea operculella]